MSDLPRSPFPSVRRVITGHTPTGKPTIIHDQVQSATFIHPRSPNAVHDLYRTNESPAIIDSEVAPGAGGWVDEISVNPALTSPDGSTFRSVDFAPGSVSPLHRTITIDYGIVTKGTLVLELDNNECVVLKEGDVIVQRATIHRWKNESSEWARAYTVMLGAKGFEIDGKKMEEEFHRP